MGVQRHAPAALPLGMTWYPMYTRLGGPHGRSGQGAENLAPTGIQFPDCPARSELLYQLRYPVPHRSYNTVQICN